MIEVVIKDYVILEDEDRNEVTFAVESNLLTEVRKQIHKMSLFMTERFSKNNTFILVNNETDDEIRFLNVPEHILKKLKDNEELFIVGVKDDNKIEYYLKITK